MRIIWVICLVFLGIGSARTAEAQGATPRIELGASAGLITATPGPNDPYGNDWYGDGRYAGSIAYYWTKNLKTEFEHQWSGEGARYEQDFVTVNGAIHPLGREAFFQLQQSSLKIVWQFGDNQWVHPYVSAGAVLDIERRHSFSQPVYQPGVRGTVIVRPATETDQRTDYRSGWTLGGGAKFYVTRKAFLNAGVIGTNSRPGATISVLTGFGIDF
jgi:opacity protein-like surface antigen